MSKTLNLIYSSRSNSTAPDSMGFFSKIEDIKNEIIHLKNKDDDIYSFDEKSVQEIARGDSYAIFPELKKKRQENSNYNITLDDIRTGLAKRGIYDKHLQDRVLFFLLQNKAGLQYGIGSAIQGFTLQSEASFFLDQEQLSVSLKVKSGKSVKMIVEFSLQEMDLCDFKKDVFRVNVEIDITSDKVTLNKVQIKKVSNSEEANRVFKYLQDNQSTLWQKIKIFFHNFTSKYLGAKTDSNLVLENKDDVILQHSKN